MRKKAPLVLGLFFNLASPRKEVGKLNETTLYKSFETENENSH